MQTILNVPSDALSLRCQEMAVRIYLKLFTVYTSEEQDGKQFTGWARQFIQRFAQRIFQHVVDLIGQRKGNEEVMTNLVNCLYQTVKQPLLRPLFTNTHCEVLLYGNCLLPLCQSSEQQLALFRDDPVEFVHRAEDLTCESLRRAVLDLIEMAASCLTFDGKG